LPISNFAIANEELQGKTTEQYYPCCGKSICNGCAHSFRESGNDEECLFCTAEINKTDEELVGEITKRADANDATSICLLAYCYYKGLSGVQQNQTKAMELYARAANLGYKKAHNNLAYIYHEGGNMKKAKFHDEAAAMAGDEASRHNIACMEKKSGNMDRAIKHFTIAASAGHYKSMHHLLVAFKEGVVSRESMDSTLAAYNMSCAEMRSEARDVCIRIMAETAQPQL
jgi:TPR repeat protein